MSVTRYTRPSHGYGTVDMVPFEKGCLVMAGFDEMRGDGPYVRDLYARVAAWLESTPSEFLARS